MFLLGVATGNMANALWPLFIVCLVTGAAILGVACAVGWVIRKITGMK